MPFIKLIQADTKKDMYVATEQIVLIGDPTGIGPAGASARLRLTNGEVFVSQTVKEVWETIAGSAMV